MSQIKTSNDAKEEEGASGNSMGETPPFKSAYKWWYPYLKKVSGTTEPVPSFKLGDFKSQPRSTHLLQRVMVRNKQIIRVFFKNMFIGRLFYKDERLRAIYETKELTLMSYGKHYNNIWGSALYNNQISKYTNDRARKNAIYILELSFPIEKPYEKISVESILYSIPKYVQKGRFTMAWDKQIYRPKQIFNTETSSQKYPFMRQSSNNSKHQYYCSCREIVSRQDVGMIFIIYPKTMRLHLPSEITEELYYQIIKLPEVLIFRHTALTEDMLKH